jgi:hypothetical protein
MFYIMYVDLSVYIINYDGIGRNRMSYLRSRTKLEDNIKIDIKE